VFKEKHGRPSAENDERRARKKRIAIFEAARVPN
jgi:hypothetical protein